MDELLLERKNRIKEYINSPEYLPLKRHELTVMLDVPAEDMTLWVFSSGFATETGFRFMRG